jgi:hypothetical protein
MTPTLALAAFAFASTLATVGIPLWRTRAKGPDSTALILTASATYFAELHERMAALESRVEFLELENRAYFDLHGPLPVDRRTRNVDEQR